MSRDELLDYLVSKHETWDSVCDWVRDGTLPDEWYWCGNEMCNDIVGETISRWEFEAAKSAQKPSISKPELGDVENWRNWVDGVVMGKQELLCFLRWHNADWDSVRAWATDDILPEDWYWSDNEIHNGIVGESISKWEFEAAKAAKSDQKPSISKPESVNEVDGCTQNGQSTPITTMNTTIDMVNRPPHYQVLPGIEVLDIRKAMLAKIPSDVGYVAVSHWDRALEYLMRCWQKNGLEDIKKAKFYMDQLIGGLENGE